LQSEGAGGRPAGGSILEKADVFVRILMRTKTSIKKFSSPVLWCSIFRTEGQAGGVAFYPGRNMIIAIIGPALNEVFRRCQGVV
jgi:hypothetical protein